MSPCIIRICQNMQLAREQQDVVRIATHARFDTRYTFGSPMRKALLCFRRSHLLQLIPVGSACGLARKIMYGRSSKENQKNTASSILFLQRGFGRAAGTADGWSRLPTEEGTEEDGRGKDDEAGLARGPVWMPPSVSTPRGLPDEVSVLRIRLGLLDEFIER